MSEIRTYLAVDKILDVRTTEENDRQFLIQWGNEQGTSWENESNLHELKKLMSKFILERESRAFNDEKKKEIAMDKARKEKYQHASPGLKGKSYMKKRRNGLSKNETYGRELLRKMRRGKREFSEEEITHFGEYYVQISNYIESTPIQEQKTVWKDYVVERVLTTFRDQLKGYVYLIEFLNGQISCCYKEDMEKVFPLTLKDYIQKVLELNSQKKKESQLKNQ